MKLLVVAALAVFPTLVVSEFAHMVIFNGNQVQDGLSCSPGNWQLVLNTISSAAAKAPKRRLKGLASRRLSCTNCGAYCGYNGQGCPGGKGGRRRAQVQEQDNDRDLQVTSHDIVEAKGSDTKVTLEACQAKIPQIEAALLALVSLMKTMEPSCAALIASSRDITCQESTLECDVTAVRLVDAKTQAVLVADVLTAATTPSICSTQTVLFDASTEFSVGRVNFAVSGSQGFQSFHTESKEPAYFQSKNAMATEGGAVDTPLATQFPEGQYTMTVTSEYDPVHSQTFTFTSAEC